MFLVDTNILLHADVCSVSKKETHRLRGNLLHDFHIAVIMREHGVEDIITRHTDFRVFPWVRIRDV